MQETFDDVVQKAFRAKVVIVSPSLLMVCIHLVEQMQKEERMREAARQIQAEVGRLIEDVSRMHDRVLKLQGHFNQTSEDVRQIVISSEKVQKRGARIAEVEFDEDGAEIIPAPMTRRGLEAGSSRIACPRVPMHSSSTLSNRTRPDCCVFMPDSRVLVIDAKFPLESVTAYRDAKSDEDRKAASQRLRTDVGKHVTDIAEKYLIPGETQEFALMFVPSEAIYAEVHDGFDDLVQKAYRERVVLMSPSLLMLAIALVQQSQKDARMREAADQIRDEVARLVKDVSLLGERVRKLQTHFNQSNEDIRLAIISIEKIESRGERIQQVEVDILTPAESNVITAPMTRKLEAGE